MDVLVLAGGFGTRLRPWTSDRAKPLLPLLDKTLLERVVECVPSGMVDRVVVAAGYGIDEMRDFSSSGGAEYEIVLSVEEEALGTGGAVANARNHLTGSGPVLVLNGDLVSSVDVESLIDHHNMKSASATLSLWKVEDPSRFGVCDLDQGGMIRRFQEKPEPGTEFSNLINAGCSVISRETLDSLPSGSYSMEREVFPEIAESGGMAGLEFSGYFVDAGTPESFIEAAQVCIQNDRFSSGHIEGDSWLGPGSKCEGEISGCSIGPGAVISSGARLTDCVVLGGSMVGQDAILNRCLVGEGSSVSPESTLDGRIIGHGESE